MSGKIRRLFLLIWIANFATLGIWQAGRGLAGWVAFDLLLAVIGIWLYAEDVLDDLRAASRSWNNR